MRSIYLDYATTTPLCPAAQQAMLPFLAEQFESPDGWGPGAEAVRQAVEDARFRVRRAIGADDVCPLWFTSGLWESLQSAVLGSVGSDRRGILLSPWEHAAVKAAATGVVEITLPPCDADGIVSANIVDDYLSDEIALVSIAHASAITGVLQPIPEIAAVCQRQGVKLHVDVSTTFGVQEVDVKNLGADFVSLSSEHVYGPKGVGALWIKSGADFHARFVGDDHGGGRVGFNNPAGIVGFAAAAQLASDNVHESAARLRTLRDQLAQELRAALGDELTIWSAAAPRVPNVLTCSFGEQFPHHEFAASLNDVVAAVVSLPVQFAGPGHSGSALRFSLGWYTDEDQVSRAASAIADAWERGR